MHPYAKLAKETVETYVKTSKIITCPKKLPKELRGKAGIFVSIHKKDKEHSLRGCIGTFSPTRKNMAEEIIHNAIAACFQDPRFERVEASELPYLAYSVDVLSEPEPVSSMLQLDVKKYGVIVESEGRRGLLLPNLKGVETPQQQVAIAMQKAGIYPDRPISIKLYRFESKRYEENSI